MVKKRMPREKISARITSYEDPVKLEAITSGACMLGVPLAFVSLSSVLRADWKPHIFS